MYSKFSASPFYQMLNEKLRIYGGFFNAHLHLDRAGTLDKKYWPDQKRHMLEDYSISLHQKHSLINIVHNGLAYNATDMTQRVNAVLDDMVGVNTRRADTLVDVTADNVGLSALRCLNQLKSQRANEIDLRIGAYSPLGFKDAEPARWEIFIDGVKNADFIGALPEADDVKDYPDHIGFYEHCRRMLELAREERKMLHVHTDQRNDPSENGTEKLVRAVKEYGAPVSENGEPMVWAVHMISPSTYDDKRFYRLVEGLLTYNIGVICCPSAAIGMRQLRPIKTPTYNCIPRVLELLDAGVTVRLASDNIADICSPTTTADLTDEVFILSAALRFYHVDILAKLACGQALDESDRTIVREHLANDKKEIQKALRENGYELA